LPGDFLAGFYTHLITTLFFIITYKWKHICVYDFLGSGIIFVAVIAAGTRVSYLCRDQKNKAASS